MEDREKIILCPKCYKKNIITPLQSDGPEPGEKFPVIVLCPIHGEIMVSELMKNNSS